MELLLLQTSDRKWYMARQMEAIPMTLSDLQGHSPSDCLCKRDLSYSSAAIDKISIDSMSRDPLW